MLTVSTLSIAVSVWSARAREAVTRAYLALFALLVIPPSAARQWTDRVATMLVLSGAFGLTAALVGVAISAAVPRLATGPVMVLAAAAIFAASFFLAPKRGVWARWRQQRELQQEWSGAGREQTQAPAKATGESGPWTP